MSTESIFEQFAAQQGWNLDSQVSILLRYIENQGKDDAFADFIKQQADQENADNVDIPTICHTDDHALVVLFDAKAWFDQASDREVKDLAACDWGGGYHADQVAKWFEGSNQDLADLFGYIRVKNRQGFEQIGFECHVDPTKAILWLEAHQPELHAEIAAIQTA